MRGEYSTAPQPHSSSSTMSSGGRLGRGRTRAPPLRRRWSSAGRVGADARRWRLGRQPPAAPPTLTCLDPTPTHEAEARVEAVPGLRGGTPEGKGVDVGAAAAAEAAARWRSSWCRLAMARPEVALARRSPRAEDQPEALPRRAMARRFSCASTRRAYASYSPCATPGLLRWTTAKVHRRKSSHARNFPRAMPGTSIGTRKSSLSRVVRTTARFLSRSCSCTGEKFSRCRGTAPAGRTASRSCANATPSEQSSTRV